jgi:hypothetical protein
MSQVSGISGLLHDPSYYGGGTHENRHGNQIGNIGNQVLFVSECHVDFMCQLRSWRRRDDAVVDS